MSRILYLMRKLVADLGGYGMLYNWFCTQEQAAVEYGYLYNWKTVSDLRNICSNGFHIPSSTEWNELSTYLGGSTVSGGKLKEAGLIHWQVPNVGATNEALFNARGAGWRTTGGAFASLTASCYFWSATPRIGYETILAHRYALSAGIDDLMYYSDANQKEGCSIRPIKDSTTLTNGQTGTYVDPSGIIYPTICIGTQEWVACNIMTKHYRNGDAIPEVTDNTAWAALTTGARCSYNNLESNAGTTKKLSSSDEWVVPNEPDCEDLILAIDPSADLSIPDEIVSYTAGAKLKEIGSQYWDNITGNETNEFNFNGRGSGGRLYYGLFGELDEGIFYPILKFELDIWTLKQDESQLPSLEYCVLELSSGIDNVSSGTNPFPAYFGFSIRFVRNATTEELALADGTYCSVYVGNDLIEYKTVKIGSKVWLAENLKETKWSDGTDIPNVTDNTAWSLLQSAACCDINNDPTKR